MSEPTMPGAWRCPQCRFTLQKNVISEKGLFADTSPFNEICPNDGTLMQSLTWRMNCDELAERCFTEIRKVQELEKRIIELEDFIRNIEST